MSSIQRRAFTLTEMLVVLAVIVILSALAFPAFNAARRRSYQATCTSNLHQLGLGVSLYQGDYDGYFPRGGDVVDLKTDVWQWADNGVYEWQVGQLPPLTYVLYPYIKQRRIWCCPADTGYDVDDITGEPVDARPSAFEKFGMSYNYRTELTLKNKKELSGYYNGSPDVEHGPEEINVFADSHGGWHGQESPMSLRRYNVLMGDGRVANMTRKQFQDAWHLRLDGPTAP